MLEDLEKKIYSGKKAAERKSKVVPPTYEPEQRRQEWLEEKEDSVFEPGKKRLILRVAAVVLFLAVLISGAVFYYGRKTFEVENVSLIIKGPQKIISGEKARFTVVYKNRNKVILTNPEIILKWPENSEIEDETQIISENISKQTLQDIPPSFEGSAYFEARIFGSKGEPVAVEATLKYRPENINTSFENNAGFAADIGSTPISISLKIPPLAVSEGDFELSVNYLNLSSTRFKETQIKVEYPDGFEFISAEPEPSRDVNVWQLGQLAARASGTIKIRGKLNGSQNEAKSFAVSIGTALDGGRLAVYAQDRGSTIISSSALIVFETMNGSTDKVVSAGDTLAYKIYYKNNSDVPISNVVIKVDIRGEILDMRTLEIPWGFLDPKTNMIMWTAAGVPGLATLDPQKEGEVSFSVQVKPQLPVLSYRDKNFTVRSTASIAAAVVPEILRGIPIGSETSIETKINTQYFFSAKGYYQSDLIPNSGLIPPKVAEKTTYTVVWRITNTSNDLEDVNIEASIPSNIEWTGNVYPKGINLKFDQATGKIKLKLDKLKAGRGIYLPAYQVAFQIALTPTINQIGIFPVLVQKTTFSAIDSFTKTNFQKTEGEITTRLLYDPSVGGEGKVAP